MISQKKTYILSSINIEKKFLCKKKTEERISLRSELYETNKYRHLSTFSKYIFIEEYINQKICLTCSTESEQIWFHFANTCIWLVLILFLHCFQFVAVCFINRNKQTQFISSRVVRDATSKWYLPLLMNKITVVTITGSNSPI